MRTKRQKQQMFAREPYDAELDAVRGVGTKTVRLSVVRMSRDDRIFARFDRSGGRMIGFAVQYECRIRGVWHEIVRVDASPVERPHRHVFHPDPTESKKEILKVHGAYGKIFHQARRDLVSHFERFKEPYLTAYEQ